DSSRYFAYSFSRFVCPRKRGEHGTDDLCNRSRETTEYGNREKCRSGGGVQMSNMVSMRSFGNRIVRQAYKAGYRVLPRLLQPAACGPWCCCITASRIPVTFGRTSSASTSHRAVSRTTFVF